VSCTLENNNTEVPEFHPDDPTFQGVLEDATKPPLGTVWQEFKTLAWYAAKQASVASAPFVDLGMLQLGVCGTHDMFLNNACLLGVQPNLALGVNVTGMLTEEAAQYLESELTTLL
jgi:hypothetical protein